MDQWRYSPAHLWPNLVGFRGPRGHFWPVIGGVAYPPPASVSDRLNPLHMRAHLTTEAQGPHNSFSMTWKRMILPPWRVILTQYNNFFPSRALLNIESVIDSLLMLYLCQFQGILPLLKIGIHQQGSDLIFWICIRTYHVLRSVSSLKRHTNTDGSS